MGKNKLPEKINLAEDIIAELITLEEVLELELTMRSVVEAQTINRLRTALWDLKDNWNKIEFWKEIK